MTGSVETTVLDKICLHDRNREVRLLYITYYAGLDYESKGNICVTPLRVLRICDQQQDSCPKTCDYGLKELYHDKKRHR